MSLFRKDRRDGTWVRPAESYAIIMPYLFKTRTESLVYYPMTIDVEPARKYIREKRNQGIDVSLFNVVVAACVRTINELPRVNRFIAGRRMYQRNEISVSYTVKKEMTLDGMENTVSQAFGAADTLVEIMAKMDAEIADKKAEKASDEEKVISALQRLPRWLLAAVVNLIYRLDYHDMVPAVLRNVIPFYSSVFISNLGSLGLNAPFHHLYELGTCSVFLTMGRINWHNEINAEGKVEKKMTMDLAMTVDERIVDGFYLSRVIRNFEHLMKHPELLDTPPEKVNVP